MIIFTDIDDTLMKTQRKIKEDISQLKVGAINKYGDPISFMDKKREKLVDQLLGQSISIPVTARSKSSFNNLQIKFKHHAILNFGATILDCNGNTDKQWHEEISEFSMDKNQKELFKIISSQILDLLKENEEFTDVKCFDNKYDYETHPIIDVRTIIEDGIHAYMNFRDYNSSAERRKFLKIQINNILGKNDGYGFYMYETDRDLALIPEFISKRKGVEYLLWKYYSKDDLIVGLGDHRNDLSFMSLCDFIMFPTDSMLNYCLEKGVYV